MALLGPRLSLNPKGEVTINGRWEYIVTSEIPLGIPYYTMSCAFKKWPCHPVESNAALPRGDKTCQINGFCQPKIWRLNSPKDMALRN